MLAWQRRRAGRLDLRHADLADDTAGNWQGFFGLYGSAAVLAMALTLATAINCIGIGFQRRTHIPDAQPSFDLSADPVPAAVDISRFYEPGYRRMIQQLAIAHISAEAPATFKRLSDLIAREHGSQRMRSQIASTIWEAVKGIPGSTQNADEHTLYWPPDANPSPTVPFRGLQFNGRDRLWREVPLPERFVLVASIIRVDANDVPRAVTEAIGYGRLTQTFRDEVGELVGMLYQAGAE